jgi:hypothetical protein
MEYCDDDREYIRVRPRKTENFLVSHTSFEHKMNIFKEYLANPANASSDVQGKHTVYWMPYTTFAKLKVKMWKYNRPCDEDRVAEIRAWVAESKRVDGVIYIACVNDELVCYESNHRRLALEGLEGLHNILVDILWDATDEEVKAEFQRLNKAVSVPELYVAPNPVVTDASLRPVVDEFCNRFKTHKKPSPRPHRPDFNRDKIFDLFYRLCDELKISPKELIEKISRLNAEMATRSKAKLSAKVIEKCTETGLWLFAWSSEICAKDLV